MRMHKKRYRIWFKAIAIGVLCIFLCNNTAYDSSFTSQITPRVSTYKIGIAIGDILGLRDWDTERIKMATRSLLEALIPDGQTLNDIDFRGRLETSQDLLQGLSFGSLIPCVYGASCIGENWHMRWWVVDEHSEEPRAYIAEFPRTGALEIHIYPETQARPETPASPEEPAGLEAPAGPGTPGGSGTPAANCYIISDHAEIEDAIEEEGIEGEDMVVLNFDKHSDIDGDYLCGTWGGRLLRSGRTGKIIHVMPVEDTSNQTEYVKLKIGEVKISEYRLGPTGEIEKVEYGTLNIEAARAGLDGLLENKRVVLSVEYDFFSPVYSPQDEYETPLHHCPKNRITEAIETNIVPLIMNLNIRTTVLCRAKAWLSRLAKQDDTYIDFLQTRLLTLIGRRISLDDPIVSEFVEGDRDFLFEEKPERTKPLKAEEHAAALPETRSPGADAAPNLYITSDHAEIEQVMQLENILRKANVSPEDVAVVYFDAHADSRTDKVSHRCATWPSRVLENNMAGMVIHVESVPDPSEKQSSTTPVIADTDSLSIGKVKITSYKLSAEGNLETIEHRNLRPFREYGILPVSQASSLLETLLANKRTVLSVEYDFFSAHPSLGDDGYGSMHHCPIKDIPEAIQRNVIFVMRNIPIDLIVLTRARVWMAHVVANALEYVDYIQAELIAQLRGHLSVGQTLMSSLAKRDVSEVNPITLVLREDREADENRFIPCEEIIGTGSETDPDSDNEKVLLVAEAGHVGLVKKLPQGETRVIVDGSIFENSSEFKKDLTGRLLDDRYVAAADICELEKYDSYDRFSIVQNILDTIGDPEHPERIIVQVPIELDQEEIDRLEREAPKGVRFMRVDTSSLNVKGARQIDPDFWKFRFDLYAALLAARDITDENAMNSPAYRILHFFLSARGIEDPDSYIGQLAKDDLNSLIRYNLSFMPAERWSRTLRYHLISINYVSGAA